MQWLSCCQHIEIQHRAKWIYFQFDVARLIRITLEENFHDLFKPQMLIATFHRRPYIVVHAAKGKINIIVIVEHLRVGLVIAPGTIRVVDEISNEWGFLPRSIVESAVYFDRS